MQSVVIARIVLLSCQRYRVHSVYARPCPYDSEETVSQNTADHDNVHDDLLKDRHPTEKETEIFSREKEAALLLLLPPPPTPPVFSSLLLLLLPRHR